MNLRSWFGRGKAQAGASPAVTAAGPLAVASSRDLARPIKVDLRPEDVPQFRRTYTARLDSRAEAEIVMSTSSYFGRRGSGTLRQPNYRYIFFDPDAIADKIIDPALVPLVQSFAETVFAMDREFMREAALEFRDEKGQLWRRA